MRKLEFPKDKGRFLIDLLSSEDKFTVLERLVIGDTIAAYVLCGHKAFTWGHFYRAAFCSVAPESEGKIVVTVSHLNLQRAWHGLNLFRFQDKQIEGEVADYIVHKIPGGKNVSGD